MAAALRRVCIFFIMPPTCSRTKKHIERVHAALRLITIKADAKPFEITTNDKRRSQPLLPPPPTHDDGTIARFWANVCVSACVHFVCIYDSERSIKWYGIYCTTAYTVLHVCTYISKGVWRCALYMHMYWTRTFSLQRPLTTWTDKSFGTVRMARARACVTHWKLQYCSCALSLYRPGRALVCYASFGGTGCVNTAIKMHHFTHLSRHLRPPPSMQFAAYATRLGLLFYIRYRSFSTGTMYKSLCLCFTRPNGMHTCITYNQLCMCIMVIELTPVFFVSGCVYY